MIIDDMFDPLNPIVLVLVSLLVWCHMQSFDVVVVQLLSCVWLFATSWTAAHQAPLPVGFPRQEHWRLCHFLLRGVFPDQELNLHFLHWQVDSLPLSYQGSLSWQKLSCKWIKFDPTIHRSIFLKRPYLSIIDCHMPMLCLSLYIFRSKEKTNFVSGS